MTVVRDFEQVYQLEDDPWSIGEADSPRYQAYLELLRPYAKGVVLDIGCGFGALLGRLYGDDITLEGVEISETAIAKGRQRFPFITFRPGNAARIAEVAGIQGRKFDLIICSDVIYYITEREQTKLLAWINQHLSAEGMAFVAAWCPGGKYPMPDELVRLVSANTIPKCIKRFSDSGHVAILSRKRRRFASITIDYETWHPIPQGKKIDWESDVFAPTEQIFSMFERANVSGTFFAEMGEYFWLLENDPSLADRMAEQWREAVRRGHDVQLHLHPCWLPETGATYKNGTWYWDWSKSKAADYPGDLTALIGRCKSEIERQVRLVQPEYTVTCFRAGAYQAQPFADLAEALVANGIVCDSSVFPHGKSEERGFHYGTPYSTHQPYFADLFDPQLKALPAEERLIELPIFTPEIGRRWFVDNDEAGRFAKRLVDYECREFKLRSRITRRLSAMLRRYSMAAYHLFENQRAFVNKLLPRKVAYALLVPPNPRPFEFLYYVAIGHTKANLRFDVLECEIQKLKYELDLEFVTLSEMARTAMGEIEAKRRRHDAVDMECQVQSDLTSFLADERNAPQSHYLQEMVPLDGYSLLDYGCRSGYSCAKLASLYPWMSITGVDANREFIEAAKVQYGSAQISFLCEDGLNLPFGNNRFDCVYSCNTLEGVLDVSAALSEIFRVLKEGGSLVAAISLDGLNPTKGSQDNAWKTVLEAVLERVTKAGFSNIYFEEVDTFKSLGAKPSPSSKNQTLYLRAWKLKGGDTPLKRAQRAMAWIYHHVNPDSSNLSIDAKKILADGHAYCMGYAVALGGLLKRESYRLTWITMVADGHPRGRGNRKTETHEVLEITIGAEKYLFDPTANTFFNCSFNILLENPSIADSFANYDKRCKERGYGLYNTSFWYKRVTKYAVRNELTSPVVFQKRNARNNRINHVLNITTKILLGALKGIKWRRNIAIF